MAMAKSSFKLSTPLETRIDYANQLRKRHGPEQILVIMEKAGDVPDLKKERLVMSAHLTVGDVKHKLRKKINLAAEKDIFVFVNNTLPPTDALMSAIYEEQKDEDDGFLYMTYSGEDIITEILFTTKISLDIIESMLDEQGSDYIQLLPNTWSHYLSAIKMLVSISASQKSLMERTKEILKSRKVAFCSLVTMFAGLRDREWVLKLGEYTNFEIRHHFAKLMFTQEEMETFYLHIDDRSALLTQSFEELADATPAALHGDIFVYFENEEAVGEGVLHEWFRIVCQMLFQPKRNLFVQSPNDSRRVSPKPALKVDGSDLKYYRFTGRIIALAIKHGFQVGFLLDPIFFRNLARKSVCLEDVKNTDETEHKSCMRVLEMKENDFGQGDMCLTFSLEIEEQEGKKVEVPLCENGTDMAVTFENKDKYINLRIQHLYVTLVKDQVCQFAKGFEDMLSVNHEIFFNTMELKDIDGLMRGQEEDAICIQDWKSYTDYQNFRETDTVMEWFWEIVNGMDQERRHNLLFFWTARMYLPFGGFEKLPQRLKIIRVYAKDHFPTSQTCTFDLRLRNYKTFEGIEKDLMYVTENDNCAGFGTM